MSDLESLKLAALGATRELMMSVEFAEQAHEAIEAHAFQPETDSEIDSAESCLIAVRSGLMEMEEILQRMKTNAEVQS